MATASSSTAADDVAINSSSHHGSISSPTSKLSTEALSKVSDGPLRSAEKVAAGLQANGNGVGGSGEKESITSPHDSSEATTSSKLGAVDQPLKLNASALGLLDYEEESIRSERVCSGEADQSKRRLGVTKFFNASKGFGFILDHEAEELGNAEVFVHYTAIQSVQGGARAFKSLLEGEEVSYFVTQGPKGWQAQNVTGPSGGPCIGTSPSSAPTTRSLYSFPRAQAHGSSDSDFRPSGIKQNRFERRPSGMVGSMSSHNGSRAAGRRESEYRASSVLSPRESYSNISSPPSQASSQLPATPQTPHYYPLPPTTMMYSGVPQPIFFASPHPYYPPPALQQYAPSPIDGAPAPVPFFMSAYPPAPPAPPPMTPIEARQPLVVENEPYPISSAQHSPSRNKSDQLLASSNPYQDLYTAVAGDDFRSTYAYPISSRAS
ncbi:hypothetical protein JCM3765_005656 [Sporobolomyces pararoseus]